MKNFSIKITGSGTKNQIEIRLLEIVRELQFTDENEMFENRVFEDDILCTKIEAE